MIDPVATAALVRAVRRFAEQTPAWQEAIRYYTKPDERTDLTLIAERVYGDRSLFMVIAAAAGLDSVEQALSERLLVLPTIPQLHAIKRETGYLTDAERRAYETLT